MGGIAIIGSDSFIASQFIYENQNRFSMKLFSRIESGEKVEIIRPDLFSISELDFENCDCVVNFVAIVHKPKLKDDNLYEKINTKLPEYLAIKAKKAGVKHFIQMSSIAVYGETGNINEGSVEKPCNIYGKTKLDADKILLSMQNESFIVSIVRPPMVYGGGNAPGNMRKLIKIALYGIPMPFKNVTNERDFINVKNLILALNLVIENKLLGVIIPTDTKAVSTEEIIKTVKKYSKAKVRLIRLPKIIHTILKKIKPQVYMKLFGSLKLECNIPADIYKPRFTLADGIKDMLSFKL